MFLEFHVASEPWPIRVTEREDLLIPCDSERQVTGPFNLKISISLTIMTHEAFALCNLREVSRCHLYM